MEGKENEKEEANKEKEKKKKRVRAGGRDVNGRHNTRRREWNTSHPLLSHD